MGRFDSFEFDEISKRKRAKLKTLFEVLDSEITKELGDFAYTAQQRLHESFLWLDKGIKDNQLFYRH